MVMIHVLEGLTASHSLWFLLWLAFACERLFFSICLLKEFYVCSIVLICCVFCCFSSFVRWLVWEWASRSPSVCAPGLESWYRPHSIWDISTHQPIQLARLEQSELWEQWVQHIMVCRVSCSGARWGGWGFMCTCTCTVYAVYISLHWSQSCFFHQIVLHSVDRLVIYRLICLSLSFFLKYNELVFLLR